IDQAEAILTVASGRTTPCVLAPAPFDPKQYRGKRTVVLKIQRAGGKPAANAPYRVELYLWQRRKRLTVAQGKLDQSGMARLSQLYELPRGEEGSVNYQVYLNNQRIGGFELVEGDDKRQITFILPPRVGEPAPNFSLIDLRTNQTVTLQSLRGKWVYLEFWATWCGPCQSAMAALKAAVDQHGSRWRGKLEIITASVDGERSVVMPHLKQRGWEQFARHCWDAGQVASNAYGVEGIPTAFLIDPQGKVVWSGHPGEEEPGAKINRYLQQGGKR
ncbi:MAG: TlpA family protein disulfide reductase, partial [Fimbriimonadales bacterium]|nr:TlpA family protein disulfide reductase [Fimbriimonadales bacterium]